MASVAKLFNDEMQSALNYSGVWIPNKLLLPGDICMFHDGQLQRTSSLTNLGLNAEIRDLQHVDEIYWATPGSFDFDVASSASGAIEEADAHAGGAVTLRFKADFAVVMRLENVQGQELADLKEVEKELVECYRQESWDIGDFFVVESLVPKRSAIFVSNSKEASASLSLGGSASTDLVATPLDARGSLALATSVTKTHGIAFHSLTDAAITPLVRLARLVDPLLGKPRVKMKSSSAEKVAPFVATGIDYTTKEPQ